MNDMNSNISTARQTGRQPSHEEISRRAQEIWERYGRPAGRDEDIWLEAERDLQQPAVTNPSAAPAPTSPVPSPRQSSTPPPPPAGTTARPEARSSRATATPRMPGNRNSRSAAK